MAEPASVRRAKRVFLIGWDAADWKMINPLLEAGRMPNLARFIAEGVMGNVASLAPMLSPILWTSIATGKTADKHQILGFAEPDGVTGSLRPVTSTSRRCKAVWNILSEAGLSSTVLNWFASHPAEAVSGTIISDRFPHAAGPANKPWPLPRRTVHPENLAERAGTMRVHPAMIGEDHITPFLPGWTTWRNQDDGQHIGHLRVLLASCSSVHRAATWLAATQPTDFTGVYYDAIDRFGHHFMEFHPPRMAHVLETDFERYREVMNACYAFHDQMLGRWMQLAGDDSTIIILSDHGFHSDHLRPAGTAKIKDGQPAAWHRSHGIIAIRGPGIKKDERIYGASLLDVTPTILWLLGLPIADDMDGRPLMQILEAEAPPPARVPTYETGPGADSPAEAEEDPWASQAILSHLAQMGYIDNDNTEEVVLDRHRNLGAVHLAGGRVAQAMEEFEKVLARKSDDKSAKMAKASCLMYFNRLDECEAIVNEVLTEAQDAPRANYMRGMICFRRGDVESALSHLRRAERSDPRIPGLHCQIGLVYARRRRWNDAARAFRKALRIDPDSADAHDGMARALYGLKRRQEAILEFMKAVALVHVRPDTHLHMGVALAEVGETDWSIQALNIAAQQGKNDPRPYRYLSQILRRAKGDLAGADANRQKADELREAWIRQRRRSADQPTRVSDQQGS